MLFAQQMYESQLVLVHKSSEDKTFKPFTLDTRMIFDTIFLMIQGDQALNFKSIESQALTQE